MYILVCSFSLSLKAIGYGLVLLDGNVVNVNKLKKLSLPRIDRLFRVSQQNVFGLYAVEPFYCCNSK